MPRDHAPPGRALRADQHVPQALGDPQVAHYGWVQPLELPGGARTRSFASPLGRGAAVRRRPPALGEHTEEVLKEIAK